jgi:hypothetical protein
VEEVKNKPADRRPALNGQFVTFFVFLSCLIAYTYSLSLRKIKNSTPLF